MTSAEPGPARAQQLRAAVDLPAADRAIITLLQDNGRRPFVEIARAVGVAEKTVRRRVAALRESGVIHITTVGDPRLLGYHSNALVGVSVDPTASAVAIAGELAEVESIDHVVVTGGRYDVMVEVLAAERDELVETVHDQVRRRPGVVRAEMFPTLRLHYQELRWSKAQRKEREMPDDGPSAPLDEIDHRIFRELNADGRKPYQSIARTLDVSESQVRQRVGRMQASGMRLMAVTNPLTLGYRAIAWLAIQVSPQRSAQEVADRLARLDSITYILLCAGRFDMFAEAVCVDDEDLLQVLDRDVRPLDGIQRVEAMPTFGLHYDWPRASG